MKKKAVIFLDYNETFDDIRDGRGKIFMSSLTRFAKHFDGEVEIVVITAAHHSNPNFSIRDDFKSTMGFFSANLRSKFKFLIEHNCRYLTEVETTESSIEFGTVYQLPTTNGSKKDGVEAFLQLMDFKNEITTCVFAGNSEESDLIMMDAEVGTREKYFLLANSRILKSEKYPVYRLSMQKQDMTYNYGRDIFQAVASQNQLIIKTGTKSYGLGKGLHALTSYLSEKERQI